MPTTALICSPESFTCCYFKCHCLVCDVVFIEFFSIFCRNFFIRSTTTLSSCDGSCISEYYCCCCCFCSYCLYFTSNWNMLVTLLRNCRRRRQVIKKYVSGHEFHAAIILKQDLLHSLRWTGFLNRLEWFHYSFYFDSNALLFNHDVMCRYCFIQLICSFIVHWSDSLLFLYRFQILFL